MGVEGRKIFIRDPKSGKEMEVVFIPKKVADRLKEYIQDKGIKPDERIFPIILRHSNLSTTQKYLRKVSDIDAMRWIDSIHG